VRLPHPVQVQPRIQGDNIRVHVIADGVFACSIATDTIDYRYGSEPVMRPTSLPPEVKKWCVHMTRVEGLRFSGIDLIRDRAGGYFCFEINPMPGYDYYERRAFADSRPISAALARELDVPHIGES
jgi:glutathione synthase/RimK-type ligase-like ATP-grasp enzyme